MNTRTIVKFVIGFLLALCGLLLFCGCAYKMPPGASHFIEHRVPTYIELVRSAEARGEIPPDLADAYIDEALAVMNLSKQVTK